MKRYENVIALQANLSELDSGEWIYANPNSWAENPKQTELYYISDSYIEDLDDDDIYIDDEGMEMPLIAQDKNLRSWMTVGSMNNIVKNKLELEKDDAWLIDEINYYRENDNFRT